MHLPSISTAVMVQIDEGGLVELLFLGLLIEAAEAGVGGVVIKAKLRVIVLVLIGCIIYGVLLILVKLAGSDRVPKGLTTHHVHFLFFDGLRAGRTARQAGEVDLKKRVGKVVLIVDLSDVLHHKFIVFVGLERGEVGGAGAEELEVVEEHAVDLMLQRTSGRVVRHQYNFNKVQGEIIANQRVSEQARCLPEILDKMDRRDNKKANQNNFFMVANSWHVTLAGYSYDYDQCQQITVLLFVSFLLVSHSLYVWLSCKFLTCSTVQAFRKAEYSSCVCFDAQLRLIFVCSKVFICSILIPHITARYATTSMINLGCGTSISTLINPTRFNKASATVNPARQTIGTFQGIVPSALLILQIPMTSQHNPVIASLIAKQWIIS